jgi:mannose-6-phosphate isomerase-like protein (cupin superfamily)
MASKGDVFELHDGESVTVVICSQDSDGDLLELDAMWTATTGKPPVHFHPYQDEHFEIRQGELSVRLAGTTHVLRSGDTLDVPAGAVHSMWHSGTIPTLASWQVRPALRTEAFFEAVHNMRAAGYARPDGTITLPAAGVIFRAFPDEFRLAMPAFFRRPTVSLLALIGRLRGCPQIPPGTPITAHGEVLTRVG